LKEKKRNYAGSQKIINLGNGDTLAQRAVSLHKSCSYLQNDTRK